MDDLRLWNSQDLIIAAVLTASLLALPTVTVTVFWILRRRKD
ncbi:hypothetical protein ACFY05_10855 [Microtetraspora fusca]|uniref:Uncharacterized protein n=1 Tax=Microtetraspora fusca TaxID=1997 RepID=A0ABW6V206_MICFU